MYDFRKLRDAIESVKYSHSKIFAMEICGHPNVLGDDRPLPIKQKQSIRFNGTGVTKENIYTRGQMYKNFIAKLVELLMTNEYITGLTFKCVAYRDGTYSIIALLDGMSQKSIEYQKVLDEETRIKREAMEQAAKRKADHIAKYKELHKFDEYEYLGYINGWGDDTPEIAKIAFADKDDCFYEDENIGRCLTRITCHKYKFYYDVDSSD